jgi:hypothetical protein
MTLRFGRRANANGNEKKSLGKCRELLRPLDNAERPLQWGKRLPPNNDERRCSDLFQKFELMAQREKKRNLAHHRALYDDLAEVATEKLRLDKDAAFATVVIQRIAEVTGLSATRLEGKRFNVLHELVALSMGAKIAEERKLASKRATIIQILLDDAVKPENFAEQIKRRGGFEKILQARFSVKNSQNADSQSKPDEDSKARGFAVRISCKPSVREKWISAPDGSSVTLTATKVGENDLLMKTLFVAGASEAEEDESAARQSKVIQI